MACWATKRHRAGMGAIGREEVQYFMADHWMACLWMTGHPPAPLTQLREKLLPAWGTCIAHINAYCRWCLHLMEQLQSVGPIHFSPFMMGLELVMRSFAIWKLSLLGVHGVGWNAPALIKPGGKCTCINLMWQWFCFCPVELSGQ